MTTTEKYNALGLLFAGFISLWVMCIMWDMMSEPIRVASGITTGAFFAASLVYTIVKVDF